MAFSKAKALHEAENLVNQGKISQAIRRYFDIIDKDPSEIILLNTIGDLYIREKNVSEALKQFYRLAEAYLRDGFTLKAIAIYKKVVKLEPDSVDPLLKLAELYQSQRLFRDAREVYNQVVDNYKKKKQNDKALETLRTVLQLDVENPTARARLAAFCEEIGRKDEALQVYLETAQLAHGRGDMKAAQIALEKAQELNPHDPQVQLLRARIALALKHPEEVEAILGATPELKDDPAGRSLLMDAYFAMQQPEKVETLVLDLFRATPGDFSPLASFVSVCVNGGRFDAASKALSAVADQLIEQGNTSSLMKSLRLIWSKSPQHLPTLELILRICDQREDQGALTEILEALGDAYMQCDQFEKAEQSFQRLVSHEPGNEHYKALLRQALQKQGKDLSAAQASNLQSSATAPAQEEGAAAPAASPLPAIDREAVVKEALENSELLARYHLVSKAVAELERVLEVYPDEIELHKRLVGMCWKDMPERAEQSARALAGIYAQLGDTENARRFAQMAGGRETAPTAARTPAASPKPPTPIPAQPAATSAGLPFDLQALSASALPSAPPSEIQEIDLSEDWESFLTQPVAPLMAPEAASFNYDDSRIELNFYLENDFFEEAKQAVADLQKTLPGDPRIAELRALVDARTGPLEVEAVEEQLVEPREPTLVEAAVPPAEEAVEQVELESGLAAPELEAELAATLPALEEEILTEPLPGVSVEAAPSTVGDLAETVESPRAGLETPPPSAPTEMPAAIREEEVPAVPAPVVSIEAPASLFADLAGASESAEVGLETPTPSPAPPAAPTEAPAAIREEEVPTVPAPVVSIEAPASLFADLAEASESAEAGLETPAPSPAPPSPPTEIPAAGLTALAAPPASPLSGSLEEMFEAPAPEPVEEDPETHYYLGVAYWEMNLVDEAIGEFQKVVKGAGKGPRPPNYLQACTMLASCFMAKGMASLAVKWYWRALETPDLDEEAWLALQYDLGVAYEQAGDLPRALERFSEVYGQNIDFRDVAEKIRTLQQKGA